MLLSIKTVTLVDISDSDGGGLGLGLGMGLQTDGETPNNSRCNVMCKVESLSLIHTIIIISSGPMASKKLRHPHHLTALLRRGGRQMLTLISSPLV